MGTTEKSRSRLALEKDVSRYKVPPSDDIHFFIRVQYFASKIALALPNFPRQMPYKSPIAIENDYVI